MPYNIRWPWGSLDQTPDRKAWVRRPMPPNTLQVHTEYVLDKSVGPQNLVGLITSAGDWRIFPSHSVLCQNCGGGDRGVAIYRPFGEFRRVNSFYHLYGMVHKASDRRSSSPLPR
ncbi:uncharacterized protein TNCV_1612111 [Trichonephila clavipes]|nr:uncharacterized protein TNCV_1612111 [Trichonephila clavipes]